MCIRDRGSVSYASTWILAALRNETFFSLADAKEAVAEKLEELNCYAFKKREGCLLYTSPIPQPLVIALSMRLRVLYKGISVLYADGIIEPPDRAGAAPKIPKLPLIVQGGGIENDVVMDVLSINMSADNESVFSLGKTPRQFTAQPVCFFRRDLTRDKRLSEMIGNHIVLAPYPASGLIDFSSLMA